MARPTLQPNSSRLANRAASTGPSANTETPNSGTARKAAGSTLITVRMQLISHSAATSS